MRQAAAHAANNRVPGLSPSSRSSRMLIGHYIHDSFPSPPLQSCLTPRRRHSSALVQMDQGQRTTDGNAKVCKAMCLEQVSCLPCPPAPGTVPRPATTSHSRRAPEPCACPSCICPATHALRFATKGCRDSPPHTVPIQGSPRSHTVPEPLLFPLCVEFHVSGTYRPSSLRLRTILSRRAAITVSVGIGIDCLAIDPPIFDLRLLTSLPFRFRRPPHRPSSRTPWPFPSLRPGFCRATLLLLRVSSPTPPPLSARRARRASPLRFDASSMTSQVPPLVAPVLADPEPLAPSTLSRRLSPPWLPSWKNI